MAEYILAIDQGTTGTTALLMDQKLKKVAEASIDFKQHFPKPGWVEHDPEDIWKTTVATVKKVTSKIQKKKILAIGITNQRETLCFWDKKTNKSFSRAIVWQDRRTADFCEDLKKSGTEKLFQEKTGLLLDPYFSGTKAAWALQNWSQLKTALGQGRLAAGTIDSFLIARITGGEVHATEPSNASRTLCFDIRQKRWDDELCTHLGVSKTIWPEVRNSVGEFGRTKGFPGLPDGIPITGVLGDQQSALLGQACIEPGMAKCTYGTGAFLLVNTGSQPYFSDHRLLTTVAWALPSGEYTYALEGSAFVAGAAVQWLRDGLGFFKNAAEVESLAKKVLSSDGVVFVPALTGMGAPFWDPTATGMFTGLTRGTTRAHFARAVLEGIAFQNTDILRAMQMDMKKPLRSLNVDGGASANNLLMQFQADVLGVSLKRPKYLETTSLGAVFAAGLGIGLWSSLQDVEKTWKQDKEFIPKFTPAEREESLERWKVAVKRVLAK
ncbi:glycerol kinase GlpK [bacterium]|jgi:glycerol kinase|nr:glycerol kinase GlpK [bacterium]